MATYTSLQTSKNFIILQRGNVDVVHTINPEENTNGNVETVRIQQPLPYHQFNLLKTAFIFPFQVEEKEERSDLFYYIYYGNSSVNNPPENGTDVYYMYYDYFNSNTLDDYGKNIHFDISEGTEDLNSSLAYDSGNYEIDRKGKALWRRSDRHCLLGGNRGWCAYR